LVYFFKSTELLLYYLSLLQPTAGVFYFLFLLYIYDVEFCGVQVK